MNRYGMWILATLIALLAFSCSLNESADNGDDDQDDDDQGDDTADDDDTDGDDDDGSELVGVWACDEFGAGQNVVPSRVELTADGKCPGLPSVGCWWKAAGGNAKVHGYYEDSMPGSIYFILVNYRVSGNTLTTAYYEYNERVLYLMKCERQ